jgi:hypothetical protein
MTKLSFEHCASCPKCFGPLRRVVEGETGDHREWKVCDFCGAEYGPWVEKQWEEPTSEPDLPCEGKPRRLALPSQDHEAHTTENQGASTGCSTLSEESSAAGR